MKVTQNTPLTKLVKRGALALGLIATTLASITSQAAPLVYETEAAKIIVVRPIDLWSGDKSVLEDSLNALKGKGAQYYIKLKEKQTLGGSPTLLQKPLDHPLLNEIAQKMAASGFTNKRDCLNFSSIMLPVSVPSAAIKDFFDYQADVYKQAVIAQGDPTALQSKTSRNKFIGAIASLGLTLAAGERFGLDKGVGTMMSTNTSMDVYYAISRYNAGLAPIELPSLDLESFKQIDVRRVTTTGLDRIGQIIIAYKDEKTEAAEHEALVIAVVALTGANSTTAEIEQARKEDFARRKAIWGKCVADGGGACKPEPIRRGGG